MNIKILGAGCKNCEKVFANTKLTVSRMGIEAEVEYITDMEKIMPYGVMRLPVLVIDEQVVSYGKVLDEGDIKKLIEKLL